MREGLKRRIKGNSTPTLSLIKKEYIGKNIPNTPINIDYCPPNSNCSNNRDSDGFWVGTNQTPQQQIRRYYAPFRQPLKGWRKSFNCSAH